MATLLKIPSKGARSSSPGPSALLTSFPEDECAGICDGVSSTVAHPIVVPPKGVSEITPRFDLPNIPRTIAYKGVTFDVARPEELAHEVPVFGERRRKMAAAKPKINIKRKCEEEEEIVWEAKRRRLIQERVIEKEFIGYSKEEMSLTEDGLRLPATPAWMNMTRERQDDGTWGIFIARPSKEDIENRWPEIIQALEPIGIEIGAAKIALPSEYLDDAMPIEELNGYISGVMGPLPAGILLPDVSALPAPARYSPPIKRPSSSSSRPPRTPRPISHVDLIPPPQLDKNGTPKIWIVDQCLPLHPLSVSNLTPIYCVSSTNKRLIRSTKFVASVRAYTARQHAIAAGDPHTENFAPLTEAAMLARGRTWDHIGAGDTGGVSVYSSDNDADPYTRAYIGVGNPHLTSLPGNVMFDSKHKIVGIHTPFFYFGAAHTIFALHAEDYNAMSLNYHHFGADKIWRVVSPRYYHVVEDFVAARLLDSTAARKGRKFSDRKCSQFVRHASIYLPGTTLEVAGARSIQFRQHPGELVITWPLAYHEGYNEGVNINEACGYGHKSWRRVFASGEEAKNGEAAIYRPCGAKCIGEDSPIILDFEPEVKSKQEGGSSDISNIEEDKGFAVVGRGSSVVGRGSSVAGRGARGGRGGRGVRGGRGGQGGRKRSRVAGGDEDGENVRVKRLGPPRKKKVTFKTEETVEEEMDPHYTVDTDWGVQGAQGDSVQIAPDQLLPIIKVKRRAGRTIGDRESAIGGRSGTQGANFTPIRLGVELEEEP